MAIESNWRPGDRFRSVLDNSWWEGQLVAFEPVIPASKSSSFAAVLGNLIFFIPWKAKIEFFWSNFYLIFRWDNKAEFGRLSPWDLEPIDEAMKAENLQKSVQVFQCYQKRMLRHCTDPDLKIGEDWTATLNAIE